MKKLLLSMAAAMAAITSVNAAETVLADYSDAPIVTTGWSGQGVLSDEGVELAAAGAKAGDVVRFYLSADAVWQLQVVEGHWDKDADGNIVIYGQYSNDTNDLTLTPYVDLTLTDAILTRAYTKSWWGNTFILNGDGNVSCSQVTLVTEGDAPASAQTVLFEGESDLTSWSGSLQIAAAKFASLAEGDKVTFAYTCQSGFDYYNIKPSNSSWSLLSSCAADDNGYGCVNANSTGTYSFAVNADDVTELKANGMIVQGYGIVLTQVVLEQEGSAEPESGAIVVWEGATAMDATWPAVILTAAQLGELAAGDQIVITATGDNSINTAWEWGPQVFINAGWSTLSGTEAKSIADGEADVKCPFVLTAEAVSQIATAGEIEVQGQNVTVTRVEVVKAATDALQQLEAPAAAARCYNLQGQRIPSAQHGLMIRGGKVVMVR